MANKKGNWPVNTKLRAQIDELLNEIAHLRGLLTQAPIAKALEAMVYDRSHDKTMHSLYPEKVYLGNCRSEYMAKQIGVEKTDGSAGAVYGHYVKSDVVIAKVIALLDALALQHALERR